MPSLIKPRTPAAATKPKYGLSEDYQEMRQRIHIDRDRLDIAVEEQAEVFLSICERQALAASKRDEAKDALARKDAELARKHRTAIEKAGQRATEALVSDAIMLDPDHVLLADVHATLKYEADCWWALRESFDQRQRMLRELVSLYASGYYGAAGSVSPRNAVRDGLVARAKEGLAAHRAARQS